MMCLAPLILAGYLSTIETSWHSSKDISGPMAEIQTCIEGLGGRMAFSQEMVQIGPQYGFKWPLGAGWALIGQVHGGLGYSKTVHPTSGITQITKWNGGVSILIQYEQWVGKVGYDHMSNGRGIDPTNAGQDMISYMIGYLWP